MERRKIEHKKKKKKKEITFNVSSCNIEQQWTYTRIYTHTHCTYTRSIACLGRARASSCFSQLHTQDGLSHFIETLNTRKIASKPTTHNKTTRSQCVIWIVCCVRLYLIPLPIHIKHFSSTVSFGPTLSDARLKRDAFIAGILSVCNTSASIDALIWINTRHAH